MTGFRYIVLSEEAGGPYWVAIRRSRNPEWLQVVARFSSKHRAETYADLENSWSVDVEPLLHGDEGVGEPSLPLPASLLDSLKQTARHDGDQPLDAQPAAEPERQNVAIEERASEPEEPRVLPITELVAEENPSEPADQSGASPREESYPLALAAIPAFAEADSGPSPDALPEPAPMQAVTLVQSVAAAIEEALPELLEKFPEGPTVRDIASFLGEPDHRVRLAMNHLKDQSRIALTRRPDSPALHIVPPGHVAPPSRLTINERRVLDVLAKHAVEGIAQVSKATIAKEASVNAGSIISHLTALELKGAIAFVERGGPQTPSKYRLIESEAA